MTSPKNTISKETIDVMFANIGEKIDGFTTMIQSLKVDLKEEQAKYALKVELKALESVFTERIKAVQEVAEGNKKIIGWAMLGLVGGIAGIAYYIIQSFIAV